MHNTPSISENIIFLFVFLSLSFFIITDSAEEVRDFVNRYDRLGSCGIQIFFIWLNGLTISSRYFQKIIFGYKKINNKSKCPFEKVVIQSLRCFMHSTSVLPYIQLFICQQNIQLNKVTMN